MGSLSQFEEYADPLLRGHLSAGKGIGRIGLLKSVENADYFLHNPILRRLSDCGGEGSQYSRGKERGRRLPVGVVTCPPQENRGDDAA